jgi:hypothetical protein
MDGTLPGPRLPFAPRVGLQRTFGGPRRAAVIVARRDEPYDGVRIDAIPEADRPRAVRRN